MSDSNVKILYLAKYAPLGNNYIPKFHEKDGVAPIYHHEIFTILNQLGYNVKSSRSLDYLYSNGKEFDYVFSLYNRLPFKNCEIFVSSLCEYLRIPYLGGSPTVRSIAEDKNLSKILACHCNVPTPRWTIFRKNETIDPPSFDPPYFIKPRYGASSEFVDESSLANTWKEAKERISALFSLGIEIILEQFIPGINLTLPVIFSQPYLVLPAIMSTSNLKENILSYNQKRLVEKGIERKIFENTKVINTMIEWTMRLYHSLSDSLDYARFDFRYDPATESLSFLEFNVCSNLGSHSSICYAASLVGISQSDLIKKIIEFSLMRQNIRR